MYSIIKISFLQEVFNANVINYNMILKQVKYRNPQLVELQV